MEEWREGEMRTNGWRHAGRRWEETERGSSDRRLPSFHRSTHPSICNRAYVNQRSQITAPKRRISIRAQHNAAPPALCLWRLQTTRGAQSAGRWVGGQVGERVGGWTAAGNGGQMDAWRSHSRSPAYKTRHLALVEIGP